MLKSHMSDRGERAAELWQASCILFNLSKIDLEKYPKGSVITKHSRQQRVLKGGRVKIYHYYYENIDLEGAGQFHLPVKIKFARGKKVVSPAEDPNNPEVRENLWNIRNGILYRKDLESKLRYYEDRVRTLIRQLDFLKNSREERTAFQEIMMLAGRAMSRKADFEECRKQAQRRLLGGQKQNGTNGWNRYFNNEGPIVTNLGEAVRSKNECLFANKLSELAVPYLYEMIVHDELVPDFTVFIRSEVLYVELLGKMDSQDYRERLAEKLARYRQLNIVPGQNLLLIDMTEGLDMRKLERYITGLFAGRIPDQIVKAA